MMSEIYGKERVRYTWNVVDDNTAVQASTLDWEIKDTLLNGDDNTTLLTDEPNTDTQSKVYESKGSKEVHTEVDFDDGWGNIYTHETNLTVEAKVYDVPVLSFSWTPDKPTILDEVTFTQDNDDTRDDEIPKAYGRIDRVDIDYYTDDTIDEEDIEKDTEWKHTFSSKQDGIEIKQIATYWDGWEHQTTELIKTMDMSNIPPVCSTSRQDNGQCIPAYVWTATSTDLDDDDETLAYEWELYKKNDNDEWESIDTGDEKEYTYPFQYEGEYKLRMKTSDSEGASDEKTEEFTIEFTSCGGAGGVGSGTILIEPNRWQMIAIPVPGVKVKDYFCDKLAEIADKDITELVDVCKAFPSSDDSYGKYLIYKPGVTKETTAGNFELIVTDGDANEINPFLLKTYDFGSDPITFTYDPNDGE